MAQGTFDFRPQRMGAIHAAKLESSPRLQRVLALLRRGGRHTTRDIVRQADVCAVNSIATELRLNGIPVHCRCIGRGRFEYWID